MVFLVSYRGPLVFVHDAHQMAQDKVMLPRGDVAMAVPASGCDPNLMCADRGPMLGHPRVGAGIPIQAQRTKGIRIARLAVVIRGSLLQCLSLALSTTLHQRKGHCGPGSPGFKVP